MSIPVISGRTVSGRPVYTVTVTGLPAADIELANRANFYGIKKLFPSVPECVAGAIAAEKAVSEALTRSGIAWDSFDLLRARSIDTEGTPVPYKAEIDFLID